MKLGILIREEPVFSLKIYRTNLKRELAALGVDIILLHGDSPDFEKAEVVWDPGLISARFPHPKLQHCLRPIIGTVHGLAGLTLSTREYFPDPLEAVIGQAFYHQVTKEWQWFSRKVSKVITVSEYGAEEVISVFNVARDKVVTIYHGIAHDIFNLKGKGKTADRPYLLQIAQFAPKKNVDRVLEAYALLPEKNRPDLVVIFPNYEGPDPDLEGVLLIRAGLTQEELAQWYRGALGFIFPSIHETFGLPILEAMACGCPIITSNVTAIPELAGDAAILVNPRSVEEIAAAMHQLVEDQALRRRLREKGLARVGLFTWEKSAREHLAVFKSVLISKHQG